MELETVKEVPERNRETGEENGKIHRSAYSGVRGPTWACHVACACQWKREKLTYMFGPQAQSGAVVMEGHPRRPVQL